MDSLFCSAMRCMASRRLRNSGMDSLFCSAMRCMARSSMASSTTMPLSLAICAWARSTIMRSTSWRTSCWRGGSCTFCAAMRFSTLARRSATSWRVMTSLLTTTRMESTGRGSLRALAAAGAGAAGAAAGAAGLLAAGLTAALGEPLAGADGALPVVSGGVTGMMVVANCACALLITPSMHSSAVTVLVVARSGVRILRMD